MLCDKCGKNTATTHIKKIINGIVTESNLCSDCAAKSGAAYKGGLYDMLASVLGDISEMAVGDNQKRCPVCGTAFADIAKTGKAGCAECYKTFYTELYPYLKRIHGTVKHVGKIPNSAPLAVVKNEETLAVKPQEETADTLRLDLNRLVSEERFEEAAVIRDKIKRLEEKENE